MSKRILPRVALLMSCVVLLVSCVFPQQKHGGLEPGKLAPKLKAEGWLNGDAPIDADLAGKVLVVDAWAYWCGPCMREAPHLVRAYDTYKDRDVVFIGLTSEGSAELDKSRRFLDNVGITWLNGYGAVETLTEFEAEGIPAVWVIGTDGKVVWNSDSRGSVEDGIENALAAAHR